MDAPPTAAAIIAGGQARRLGGRDKSRLLVEGRPIIVRQLDVLQQLTSEIFVVANDAGRFADLGLRVEPDVVLRAGALGGLHTALVRASPGLVIVVAADMPFLSTGLLGELAARATTADGAWVRTTRGVEPLLACYQTRAAAIVRQQIEGGRLRAADLGSVLRMRNLDESEIEQYGPVDRLLTNVNTAEDYARVQYRPA